MNGTLTCSNKWYSLPGDLCPTGSRTSSTLRATWLYLTLSLRQLGVYQEKNSATNVSNSLWRGAERLARGSASLDPHIAASASSSRSPTNQIHLFMQTFIPTTTVVLSAYLDGIERIFQAGAALYQATNSARLYPHIAVAASNIAPRVLALPIQKTCVRLTTSSTPSPTRSPTHPIMKSFAPTATVVLAVSISLALSAYIKPQAEALGGAKGSDVLGLKMIQETLEPDGCAACRQARDGLCDSCRRAITVLIGASGVQPPRR
ncbi:hypothetical protein PCANC_11949 [Puccinia coronata f. sp. avenae]|uniref:Uncharacterized protein n=1 Tax=Puccinia coronata f. sp. avenae TaxID=200324 RepID=A0A2N5T385_9BASI|nr:hypothetical protein PCANC_11949 [Puccinia coronata f. sp. avenae]